jgi:hypothetical protein
MADNDFLYRLAKGDMKCNTRIIGKTNVIHCHHCHRGRESKPH